MEKIEDIIFDKLTNPSVRPGKTVSAAKAKTAEVPGEFADACFHDLNQNIAVMERTRNNLAHRPIYSHRKVIGGLIVFGKKLVRKFLKWYIDPFAEQQLTFNNGARYAVGGLTQLVTELFSRSEKAEAEIDKINDQMEQLLVKLAELEAQTAPGKQSQQKGFLPFAEQMTNSQSGEDSIAAYIALMLGYQPQDVTYLDLGANHAKEMSNTYRFYQYGARGVLVEANPELIPELNEFRNGDVIINKCISATDGERVDFFIMSGDGLSTKNEASANNAVDMNPAISIKEKVSVESVSVNTLLEKHFEEAPVLLNVDLEGCEMEVLPSIDFEKYRPLIIIVETIPYSTSLVVGQKNTEVIDFLNQKGYTEYAFTGINSIFVDRTNLQQEGKP